MSEFKIAGMCTVCDAPCFEVLQVYEAHERRPGEPKRLGRALDGATRIAFRLLDGTRADMTFCADCAASLTTDVYVEIWRKCLRSWTRELEGDTPDWYFEQFNSGILVETGRVLWKELGNG